MATNSYNSAKKQILILIGSIYIGELLIMVAFAVLPKLPEWIETIVDPTILSIFCAPILYLNVFRPTTRRISQLSIAKNQLRTTAAAFETYDAIMITDAEANIIRVNRAFERTTGFKEEEVIGKTSHILKSELHDQAFYTKMMGDLLTKNVWSGEVWDKHKDGSVHPKLVTISAIKNAASKTTQYVSIFTDISDRKKAEKEIHNLAFYDTLTGLPNRRLLRDRLEVALTSSARSHQYGALLFLDLDNFKTLNDSLGHEYGDMLLVEVANRIKFSLREADTVARLGGDEFVILVEKIGTNSERASQRVALLAEKIRTILTEPYQLKESLRHSSPSIGICMFCDQDELVDELLKRADMAMYQAKSSGRNKTCFFDPRMQQLTEKRAALESDLRIALTEGQLRLHYQIQLDQERIPIGAEALVRWIHPQHGMVPPSDFIPVAEESSLIVEIGDWVLDNACRQIAEWRYNEQTRNLVLAVNISAQQFTQPDFVEKITALLKKYSIEASRLKLELTESVVVNDLKSVVAKMNVLRDTLGVTLSLDDFGTGYSSLSYLKQLPLDQIKIDQSFVRDMTTDASDAMMVKNIIDMAHNFGLNVIAEGVETEDQLALLKKNGCKSYQGYLFSKPIPIEQFEIFLTESQLPFRIE